MPFFIFRKRRESRSKQKSTYHVPCVGLTGLPGPLLFFLFFGRSVSIGGGLAPAIGVVTVLAFLLASAFSAAAFSAAAAALAASACCLSRTAWFDALNLKLPGSPSSGFSSVYSVLNFRESSSDSLSRFSDVRVSRSLFVLLSAPPAAAREEEGPSRLGAGEFCRVVFVDWRPAVAVPSALPRARRCGVYMKPVLGENKGVGAVLIMEWSWVVIVS